MNKKEQRKQRDQKKLITKIHEDKAPEVYCENKECNKFFKITRNMIQSHYLGAMYTGQFLVCPYCGRRYIIAVWNKKARGYLKNKNMRALKMELGRINGKN